MIKHGWDWTRGGLIERLTPEGTDHGTPFRRVMVHARQIYVFSTWASVTGDRVLSAHADRIFEYMTERFWDYEHGGWIEKVDLVGKASGFDKDLYAHAFALFGLGTYRDALERDQAAVWLDRTREVLDGHFRRADGSFSDRMSRTFEDLVPERRSQNPHMHLLEAALSLAGKGQGEAEADLARRLLELFRGAFHDAGNAVVLEHLGPDFAPHGTDGHRVEPGHHFEWAWLLDWASRILGETSYREMAMPILACGLSSGWDQNHGGVFDEVDRRDGGVLMSTKRIWPLLELIKALAVFPNSSAEVSLLGAVDLMLDRYLTDDGRWTERFNADWTPAEQTMPASTAYHISTALAELERAVSKE